MTSSSEEIRKILKKGNLAANWEGPYKIGMKTRTGVYDLDGLVKGPIPGECCKTQKVLQLEGDQASNSTVHTKFKLTNYTLSPTSTHNGRRNSCHSESKTKRINEI